MYNIVLIWNNANNTTENRKPLSSNRLLNNYSHFYKLDLTIEIKFVSEIN